LGSAVTIRRIAFALLLLVMACTDATGVVQGGQALISCGGDAAAGAEPTTFTALYQDFFGPCGQTSCSALSTCHGSANMVGANISGFVCGSTKEQCWEGMTMGIPPDAGGVFPAIITPGLTDPTTTIFYKSLREAPPSPNNPLCSSKTATSSCNMPCGDPPLCHPNTATYTFTASDLARISTWLQQGAQDN